MNEDANHQENSTEVKKRNRGIYVTIVVFLMLSILIAYWGMVQY